MDRRILDEEIQVAVGKVYNSYSSVQMYEQYGLSQKSKAVAEQIKQTFDGHGLTWGMVKNLAEYGDKFVGKNFFSFMQDTGNAYPDNPEKNPYVYELAWSQNSEHKILFTLCTKNSIVHFSVIYIDSIDTGSRHFYQYLNWDSSKHPDISFTLSFIPLYEKGFSIYCHSANPYNQNCERLRHTWLPLKDEKCYTLSQGKLYSVEEGYTTYALTFDTNLPNPSDENKVLATKLYIVDTSNKLHDIVADCFVLKGINVTSNLYYRIVTIDNKQYISVPFYYSTSNSGTYNVSTEVTIYVPYEAVG